MKSKFKGVYSQNNLPKTKVGAYAINIHEYKSKEVPKEVKKLIGRKNITQSIIIKYKQVIQ